MDSDEEEMAAMRKSSRYGGGRVGPQRPPEAAEKAPSPKRSSPEKAVAVEEDDEEAELRAMQAMLGMSSFGKVEETELRIDNTVHAKTRRSEDGTDATPKEASASSKAIPSLQKIVDISARRPSQKTPKTTDVVMASMETGLMPSRNQARQQEEDSDEEDENLPFSHETSFNCHKKSCEALAVDKKGARAVTGGRDGYMRLWDFGGMTKETKFFREMEVSEGHAVQALSWAPNGGMFLCITTEARCRIFDRDGSQEPIQQTILGDMYVRDLQHTKGHTQMITDGMWHPADFENWVTSSLDGSCRIWSLAAKPTGMDQWLPCVHVLKCLDKRNVCTGGAGGMHGMYPTCVQYAPDGKAIIAGCSDGSLQLFYDKQRYVRPDRIVRKGHIGDISAVAISQDNRFLISRSMDDTMKLWDLRKFSDAAGPVKSWGDMPALAKTGVCLSPDGRYVCAGVVSEKKGGTGAVNVFDLQTLGKVKSMTMKDSVVKLAWPAETNQLIATTSGGNMHICYDPEKSKKGALLFLGKTASKRRDVEASFMQSAPILAITEKEELKKFYAMKNGDLYKIRKTEKRANQKTIVPPKPESSGPEGARGAPAQNFMQRIMQAMPKNTIMDENAQEALLAQGNPTELIGDAYKDTQPVNILDWTTEDAEGDKILNSKRKICPRCGLKLCACGYMDSKKAKTDEA